MKFVNVRFNQEKFFDGKKLSYQQTDTAKPSKKEMESDLKKALENVTCFGEDAIEKVLKGEKVENGYGGFVYANTDESGYNIFVCESTIAEGIKVVMNHTFAMDANVEGVVLYTSQGDYSMNLVGKEGYKCAFDGMLNDCAEMAGLESNNVNAIVRAIKLEGTGEFSLCGCFYTLNASIDHMRQSCYITIGHFAEGLIEEKIWL